MSEQWTIQGKVCLVTGANCGIGRETACELVRKGAARIILACRNLELGEAAIKYIRHECGIVDETEAERRLALHKLDLSSLESVRQCAKQLNEQESTLNCLILNAGVLPPLWQPKVQTEDGFELAFGTNHLGHFLLVNLLLDVVKRSKPARIVVVASGAYIFSRSGFHIEDPNFEAPGSYGAWSAYSQSKLANILYARELHRRLNGNGDSGVTVYSLHPGGVKTQLGRNGPWYLQWIQPIVNIFLLTPLQGAQTSLYCATQPGIEQHSGKYFQNSALKAVSAFAEDDVMATRLWEVSEKLLNEK